MFSLTDVLGKVGDIFTPVASLIDNVHTSEEEKLKLKNSLVSLQNEVTKGQMELLSKAMDLEKKALEAQTAVLTAEAGSQSWIARNWRPLTMLNFVIITTLHALGLIDMNPEMSGNYFDLVKLGLGGYVAGRSLEKIAPAISKSLGK